MSNYPAYDDAVRMLRALRPEQRRLALMMRCLVSRTATPEHSPVYWLIWFRWRAVTNRIEEIIDMEPYPRDDETINGDIPPLGPMPTYG